MKRLGLAFLLLAPVSCSVSAKHCTSCHDRKTIACPDCAAKHESGRCRGCDGKGRLACGCTRPAGFGGFGGGDWSGLRALGDLRGLSGFRGW